MYEGARDDTNSRTGWPGRTLTWSAYPLIAPVARLSGIRQPRTPGFAFSARLDFWAGDDAVGRPAELGAATGAFVVPWQPASSNSPATISAIRRAITSPILRDVPNAGSEGWTR